MRYISKHDAERLKVNLDVANIHRSGSVKGMQQIYGWTPGAQVRIGLWVYNVGLACVSTLRAAGVLKGE